MPQCGEVPGRGALLGQSPQPQVPSAPCAWRGSKLALSEPSILQTGRWWSRGRGEPPGSLGQRQRERRQQQQVGWGAGRCELHVAGSVPLTQARDGAGLQEMPVKEMTGRVSEWGMFSPGNFPRVLWV